MSLTTCQLLSASIDEPFIHAGDAPSSFSENPQPCCGTSATHQAVPPVPNTHLLETQQAPETSSIGSPAPRGERRGEEVRCETRSISHSISWIRLCYLQGPARGRGRRGWCRAQPPVPIHNLQLPLQEWSHSCGHQRSRKSNFHPILWVKMEEPGEQRLLLIPIC